MDNQNYKYAEILAKLTNQELTERFNLEVGNQGWGNARAAYLSSLHNELLRRNFDASLFANEKTMSLARKVKFEGGKVVFSE